MSIVYVLIVISINVLIIILWEIYKKRRFSKELKKASEIQELIANEKYETALSMLKKVEKLYPPVAYEMMGECYYKMGDKEKAHEFYNKSLSIDSTMGFAHVGIAQIEIDKGEYAEAECSLKRALGIDKSNYIAMYYLARIYNIWGKYSEASDLIENAIAKGLVMREAYLMLRDYYQASGDDAGVKRIDKKIELLDQRGN